MGFRSRRSVLCRYVVLDSATSVAPVLCSFRVTSKQGLGDEACILEEEPAGGRQVERQVQSPEPMLQRPLQYQRMGTDLHEALKHAIARIRL